MGLLESSLPAWCGGHVGLVVIICSGFVGLVGFVGFFCSGVGFVGLSFVGGLGGKVGSWLVVGTGCCGLVGLLGCGCVLWSCVVGCRSCRFLSRSFPGVVLCFDGVIGDVL